MNVREIVPTTTGTLGYYLATAICFTVASVWIIVAFQSQQIFGEETTMWHRFCWPFMLFKIYRSKKKSQKMDEDTDIKLKLIPK
jgi:hypothetical protein